ncbi:hypothetical protein [Photobacterium angustum]|uniref:hypothetical protein n=1 Tax=Photobacterium angustum TaxID=661 RepID=UPI000699CD4B|nr:hypothetical protein [Photobacterium angustum]PSV61692.1 hypothetical protein CTM95_20535 [Photobacterium angustum]
MSKPISEWTEEEIQADFKKWRDSAGPQAARLRLAAIRNLQRQPTPKGPVARQSKWTEKKIQIEASKYKYRANFNKEAPRAYDAARRRGLLDKVCSHMTPPPPKWTEEKIQEEANKYKRRVDFEKGSPRAYDAAYKRRLLDKVCGHMTPKRRVWTEEKIQTEANKYKYRGDFLIGSPSAYNAARRWGLLDKVCAYMEPKWAKIPNTELALLPDRDQCLLNASRCRSLSGFKETYPYNFNYAEAHGLLDECEKRMINPDNK